MELNRLSPAPGSTKARKRVGRGIGSGSGKTCGTGHKGQKSRSGGSIRPGFEGGQMPLQMRLPKYGFSSRIGRVSAEVRTSELNKLDADVIDIEVLRKANLVTANIKRVKVMLSGEISKSLTLQGIGVTKGARAAIESAGGKIVEDEPVKKGKLVKKEVAKVEAKETVKKPARKKAAKPKVEAAVVEEKPAADKKADKE
ncbi:MAG: 50S ribosomal protein L15 [SAR86 cluster bacterium]|uniref:Large ribosomal subunit protein uL15 n=1 Tax=SAR86 cluster bacterium TaxID=2030880 RepID=A0A2A5B4C4_9GAMM|nr:MAG: 50S ribosomal protein L15 [SAR86 cluster bacterium]